MCRLWCASTAGLRRGGMQAIKADLPLRLVALWLLLLPLLSAPAAASLHASGGKPVDSAPTTTNEKWVDDGRTRTKNGHGRYTFPSGAVYDGRWQNGHMHGQGGTLTYPNGDRYTGGWYNGKKHGPGTYVRADGFRVEADWDWAKKGLMWDGQDWKVCPSFLRDSDLNAPKENLLLAEFDTDQTGLLEPNEFSNLMRANAAMMRVEGLPATDSDVRQMFRRIDTGALSFAVCCQ
jgi:hypothetical protein